MSNKTKYFGTDGFRGKVNSELTAMHAFKIGRFLGWYYKSLNSSEYRPRIAIGKDTRRSSYMLEYAIASGITSSGADAYMLHVTTTPSVSYVVKQDDFDCGIMITASHNPFSDNGIKVINSNGEKMDDEVILLIEAYLDGDYDKLNIKTDIPLALGDEIGRIIDYVAGRNRYVGYLISLASHSYRGLKIGLDCANGASWMIAKSVFDALGAQTYLIGASPNGININENCGSTNIKSLSDLVKEKSLDVGFAFDGDADRCIAVDECGNVVDGDKIIYILAKSLKDKQMLTGNTVVATVMSNMALIKALNNDSINCVTTAVGDRFVYSAMQEGDYQLGGEQSGHIIIRKYATTGDALLTAIMLTEEMKDRKCKFSKLCDTLSLNPQINKNYSVADKNRVIRDNTLTKQINDINKYLGNAGRVILRASGTESLIRVMAEAESYDKCESLINQIEQSMKERNHLS